MLVLRVGTHHHYSPCKAKSEGLTLLYMSDVFLFLSSLLVLLYSVIFRLTLVRV